MLPITCISSQNSDQVSFCLTGIFIDQKAKSKQTEIMLSGGNNFQLIARYPHDTSAFTQGLVFYKGNLFESTGLLNKSAVRKINIADGKVLLKTQIPDIYFGEGLTVLNNQIVQMSWKSGKVFFFHSETLDLIKKINIEMDVWGSTTIDGQLVISNGTSYLFFLSPETLSIDKTLKITLNNREISGLNALEYAEDYIYANVWPSHCIVKINPDSGRVMGWLNLAKLYPDDYQLPGSAVLNGIAYHKQYKSLFVTGKYWPYLYQIKWQSNEN